MGYKTHALLEFQAAVIEGILYAKSEFSGDEE